jgi:omega-6 fatty acid desaturase (delta-12 desaturase)
LVPVCLSLLKQRFPHPGAGRRERNSVTFTNVAVLAILALATLTIGLGTLVLVQLPITLIAGTMGVWLFYVQHQYEGVYWALPTGTIRGAGGFYQLPRFCVGYGQHWPAPHHHIRPRIRITTCSNATTICRPCGQ